MPIDPNIRRLCAALNRFEGIETIGSCGGHENPQECQAPAGSWWVTFGVAHTEDGWRALEFLAWLINNDYARAGRHVICYPEAAPPYLNHPGHMLRFALEGQDNEDPNALAAWINKLRRQFYVPPGAEQEGVTSALETA